MKKSILKLSVLLSIVLWMLPQISNAQFSASKRADIMPLFALGGGISGGQMGNADMYGGNIMLEVRIPISKIGSSSNFSVNLTGSAMFGNKSERSVSQFLFLPVIMPNLSINLYSQSSKKAKNAFGGFLGIGAMYFPGDEKTVKDKEGNESIERGGFGVALLGGPRFRLGKSYMGLRFFGGITTIGSVYGGMNLMFTVGMDRKRNMGMH
ncbi:MAG: hypothetical protein JXR60_08600 [Bacteroidales bacterium]|nr:hypothetical protein [Bacteroidales bacterium]